MAARTLFAAALLAAVCLQLSEAFTLGSVPSLRTRASGVCAVSMKERKDGASEQDVAKGWDTYKMLMDNKNFGKGYWMDSRFQFFTNIQTAIARNFGDNKVEIGSEEKGMIDLSSSPFKPMVTEEDFLEFESEGAFAKDKAIAVEEKAPKAAVTVKKPKKKVTPPKAKPAAEQSDDDIDAKMQQLEKAREEAKRKAAEMKKKLEE